LKGKPRILSIRLTPGHQKEERDKIVEICKEISPDFHNRISFVSESLQNFYSAEIKLSKGITLYAVIAFILSILGIIGICTIRLQKRRKEIAIRRIHGADITDIIELVLWDFLPWVFLANILSVPITTYLAQMWLQSYAFHGSLSPVAFLASTLISLIITSLIILTITSNICRENPVIILHEE
jgi:putative ABC transport system permease protein